MRSHTKFRILLAIVNCFWLVVWVASLVSTIREGTVTVPDIVAPAALAVALVLTWIRLVWGLSVSVAYYAAHAVLLGYIAARSGGEGAAILVAVTVGGAYACLAAIMIVAYRAYGTSRDDYQ